MDIYIYTNGSSQKKWVKFVENLLCSQHFNHVWDISICGKKKNFDIFFQDEFL